MSPVSGSQWDVQCGDVGDAQQLVERDLPEDDYFLEIGLPVHVGDHDGRLEGPRKPDHLQPFRATRTLSRASLAFVASRPRVDSRLILYPI